MGNKISPYIFPGLLKNEGPKPAANIQDIFTAVSHVSGLKTHEIMMKRRTAKIVMWRQITIWLARKHANMTVVALGELFGCDHSSVCHSSSKVDRMIELDHENYRQTLAIVSHLYGHSVSFLNVKRIRHETPKVRQ